MKKSWSLSLFLSIGLISSSSLFAGALYADHWGNVYEENNPFPIAWVDSMSQGPLRSDTFGRVYVGDDPFSVGEIDNHGYSGPLHNDHFGHTYVGESPFSSDLSGLKKQNRR